MSAYVCTYTTRQLAALALAVGLALGLGFVDQSIGRSSRDTSAALPPEGTAPEISGIARVIDGDTIHIGESRIRLEGIDAPEEAQTCARATGESWPCGRAATSEMQRMAHGRHVTCRHLGFDKYNRVLGACRQGDLDLNAEMVRRGMLKPREAASSRLRHVITNVLGGADPGVKVEMHSLRLDPGDSLLLCSDGLCGMIDDDTIATILEEEADPADACARLIAAANEQGGKDNITAIVVRFRD